MLFPAEATARPLVTQLKPRVTVPSLAITDFPSPVGFFDDQDLPNVLGL